MSNRAADYFRFLMQLTLYREVRRHRARYAAFCWDGYRRKGKGCLILDQREGTRLYHSAQALRAGGFERLEGRGLDVKRLQAYLCKYDPGRAGVLVTLDARGDELRRSLAASRPELAEVLLGSEVPEIAVMQRFHFAPSASEDPDAHFTAGERAALNYGLSFLLDA